MQATATLTKISRADHIPGPAQGNWTYEAYCAIPDDGRRYQIVDGVLYVSPSSRAHHQNAVGLIYAALLQHVFRTGLDRVMLAPFDVLLGPKNIVQPDVLVMLSAHLDQLTDPYVDGAPDLVVEMASKSTSRFDHTKKLRAYESAGVPEY